MLKPTPSPDTGPSRGGLIKVLPRKANLLKNSLQPLSTWLSILDCSAALIPSFEFFGSESKAQTSRTQSCFAGQENRNQMGSQSFG